MDISHDTARRLREVLRAVLPDRDVVGVAIYAFWPSLGKRFDRAAKSVLDDEDGPCR